jgi:acylphosphatase
MGELTKHYLISGRVQGVGFRAFTARSARELALKGWVRNLQDGRVEAVAHGPSDVIAEFENRLKKGPPAGRVDTMTVESIRGGSYKDFEVRKDGSTPCAE